MNQSRFMKIQNIYQPFVVVAFFFLFLPLWKKEKKGDGNNAAVAFFAMLRCSTAPQEHNKEEQTKQTKQTKEKKRKDVYLGVAWVPLWLQPQLPYSNSSPTPTAPSSKLRQLQAPSSYSNSSKLQASAAPSSKLLLQAPSSCSKLLLQQPRLQLQAYSCSTSLELWRWSEGGRDW